MPALTYSASFANGETPDADPLLTRFSNIATLLNTTKLDGDNIQSGAIVSDLIAGGAVGTTKLADDAVTKDKVNGIWPWSLVMTREFYDAGGFGVTAGQDYLFTSDGFLVLPGTNQRGIAAPQIIHLPGPFTSWTDIEWRLSAGVFFDGNALGRVDSTYTFRLWEVTADVSPTGCAALTTQRGTNLSVPLTGANNWSYNVANFTPFTPTNAFFAVTMNSSATLSGAGPFAASVKVYYRPVG